MKIYGFNLIKSDGLYRGKESFTALFYNYGDAIDAAFRNYEYMLNDYLEGEQIESEILNETQFIEVMDQNDYVFVQYPDFHCQWELFEKEIR